MKNFCGDNSGLTEITENKEQRSLDCLVAAPLCRGAPAVGQATRTRRQSALATQGWILYDGQCRYCFAAATQFGRLFARRGFHFLPLQTPWIQERLGLDPGAPLEEMRVLTESGQDIAGAEAVIFLARQIWWARPFWLLSKLPGMPPVIDRAYRWIAARRSCTHIACQPTAIF